MGYADSDRSIRAEVIVNACLGDVWDAWTTNAGIKSFFAPECNVELRVNGPFEIFFFPEAVPGERGAEGTMVLAFQLEKMFAFTWGTPPFFPTIFEQRMHVVVRFEKIAEKQVRVMLVHDGWGVGGEWDSAFDFFTSAWADGVLPQLQQRFAVGPIDWEKPEANLRKRRWARN